MFSAPNKLINFLNKKPLKKNHKIIKFFLIIIFNLSNKLFIVYKKYIKNNFLFFILTLIVIFYLIFILIIFYFLVFLNIKNYSSFFIFFFKTGIKIIKNKFNLIAFLEFIVTLIICKFFFNISLIILTITIFLVLLVFNSLKYNLKISHLLSNSVASELLKLYIYYESYLKYIYGL